MGDDTEHRSSKHKRHHDKDKDGEHKSKKRSKHDKDDDRHRDEHRPKKRHDKKVKIIDDDPDEAMWVEKNIDMDGENPLATDIPSVESLKLKSHANVSANDPPLPRTGPAESKLVRDEWMMLPPSAVSVPAAEPSSSKLQIPTGDESFTEDYGEPTQDARTMGGGVDFFSNLGTERKKKKTEDRPDPEKFKISSKELNTNLVQGISLDQYPHSAPKATVPGGPGSNWRMMKLRRVYEAAEEEGKPVEDVALERYGSLDAFEEAKEERQILDEREGRRSSRGGRERDGGRDRERSGRDRDRDQRWMFTDVGGSGASSRSSSFRRPGESGPSTPSPAPSAAPLVNKRVDSLRLPPKGSPLSLSHTPVPSVMTPPPLASGSGKKRLSTEELNRMQARVLRAKLMGTPDAANLEKEYEEEQRRATSGFEVERGNDEEGKTRTRLEVLPTLDSRGRLYDVGAGREDGQTPVPGNRKKKDTFETRDPKTGDIIRYNADDDELTLGEMLRQERFGAGMADQKSLDAELATAITRDGKFEDDLEYMDDNAEKLGRKKMRSDGMKRQFAINDYKKTQKVLASCQLCYGEDDSPPKAPVIAMATRCFLSCTLNQELLEGHCLIVPIQHHLTMLEGDDDLWDEVRNFMKCLMRMFAEEDKGVVFYETVINIKWQKHTFIECMPMPWEEFEQVPAYFKESILASETEWTQHRKLIDFAARPGGFRRAMVPNLPYFMVQFDHKGEKGYGHVIEGTDDAAGAGEGDGAIIGNVLDLEPRRWRRPRRVDLRYSKERVAKFRKKYDKFDWTGMIGKM
ncbi:CwfJ C-terminus 1-domain-containing protein-like protein [Phellopilus nigrolimitatus]|nr:CwfJ C-terminus 1-domain-containing protein-like protein [Phellopilus nigrolimitatus]